jgi:hypothetical protein
VGICFALKSASHSGGICINEALLQVGVDDLPFGGIGHSGMGDFWRCPRQSGYKQGRIKFDETDLPSLCQQHAEVDDEMADLRRGNPQRHNFFIMHVFNVPWVPSACW